MRPATNHTFEFKEASGSTLNGTIPFPPPSAATNRGPSYRALTWWRKRAPNDFVRKDIAVLRWALLQNKIPDEPYWSEAVIGEVTAAIDVAIGRLKVRPIDHNEIDLALSAMLACALEHDVTSRIVITSALRRRSKIDPSCQALSELWLTSEL